MDSENHRASQANCELAKMNSKLREEQRALRKEAATMEHRNKLLGNALKAAQAQLHDLKSAAGLESALKARHLLLQKEAELEELDSKFERLLDVATVQFEEKEALEEQLEEAQEHESELKEQLQHRAAAHTATLKQLDFRTIQLASSKAELNDIRSKVKHTQEEMLALEAVLGPPEEAGKPPALCAAPPFKYAHPSIPAADRMVTGDTPPTKSGLKATYSGGSPGSDESVGSPFYLGADSGPRSPKVVRSAVAQALEDFNSAGNLMAVPR